MSENNRDFKVLSDREHCLCRPNMYIGSVNLTARDQWIFDATQEKFKYKSIKVVPALLKCASELIDNSIDVAIDTDFKAATKIKVNVDSKSIEVIDDGIGIPCVPPAGVKSTDPKDTCTCLAWTRLKAGTSFDDNRKKIGTNGVGSSCVNVFSKLFIGISDDGKHKQKIECSDNMSIIKASKVGKSSGKSGVSVYCEPDLERFGLKEIDAIHIGLIRQRLVNLAICYPKIKFIFNGERVAVNEKKFAQMFSDDAVIESSDNATICVFPNEYDEFRFYSCVNGIDTMRGGIHVDHVSYELCNRVRDKLVKKFKNIRPGDIKNKICVAVLLTGFTNPEFDSQTKESLTNSSADMIKHLDGKIDFEQFAKQILKNDAIINPIVDMFKLKEELKARQELKKVKKIRVKSDKYMRPSDGTGQKYLALVEGNSAASGLQASIGNEGIGYFACRGLPINAYSQSIQRIVQNEEFKTIMSILEMDMTAKENVKKTISFDKILIATDSDSDGSHLSSMFLGWFKRFAENLFYEGKICKLNIPLVLVIDKNEKVIEHFFNLADFNKWEKAHPQHKYHIEYWKGLGSISKSYLNQLLDKYGFDAFVETYKLDDSGKVYLDHWLNDECVMQRKEYLKNYTLDINNI